MALLRTFAFCFFKIDYAITEELQLVEVELLKIKELFDLKIC